MTWLSNKTNLFKAGWIMVDDSEKCIIDNNELANRKIEQYHEEEAKRLMAERQENGEDVFFDGFSEGIGYDQINNIDGSENIIGADPPVNYGSDEFQGFGEDPGMIAGTDISGADGFDASAGFAGDDMNLGMDMGEEAPAEYSGLSAGMPSLKPSSIPSP